MMTISRREIIRRTVTAGALLPWAGSALAAEAGRFKISACDWSIHHKQRLDVFPFAKSLGLDGVQFSFNGGENDLRSPQTRQALVEAVRNTGVAVSSLAMGILNSVPYSSNPDAERWVQECVEVMASMKAEAAKLDDKALAAKVSPTVVLLAFFGRGDIKGKPDLQQAVIQRLKKVAPAAEKAGVIIGLETWLDVEDHLRILDGVDSPAVKVYYDTANMTKQGYDIIAEIRRLGRERICELHLKENGALLGKGKVDFAQVEDVITEIGFSDWLTIESAIPRGMPMEEAYKQNVAFVRKQFA
jgi:L-ribulose-5-phosphate 3-epimerase